jgi:eukaryotic-like serine/threonine-protein kinase
MNQGPLSASSSQSSSPSSSLPSAYSPSSSSSSHSSSIKNEEQDVRKFTTWELPSYGVKINYPSSWRVEKAQKSSSTPVIFKPLQENLSDTLFESVSISSYNTPTHKKLEQFMQEVIHDLEKKYHDFSLIEIVPTLLAGRQAHRMVYDAGGKRFMGVVTIEKNKAYQVMYAAEPAKYDTYLPIVQKMIDSFEITANK